MTPRFYLYKLTHDDGAAPCVEGDLFTLAICKPRIRAAAQVGDVIFGFAANSLSRDNRLIYIARVTAVEPDGEYYEEATYRQRGDCIYIRGDDGRFASARTRAITNAGRCFETISAVSRTTSVRVCCSARSFDTSGAPSRVPPSTFVCIPPYGRCFEAWAKATE